jgi:hypothetical protein
MSTWSEDRRKDKAADAEQRRRDADATAERRAKERALEDARRRENAAADKAQARAEKAQARRDRAARRRERAQAWTKNTTPEVIYRRGTLALVTASALASLPAQVMHFVAISTVLLPLPFALEGAAWVMAAGVAYADEKNLPGWVRWLLRILCLSAAGYAASINYQYGRTEAPAAGYGLAAVSLLGPLFFEVRQWVMTLSAGSRTPQQKREAKARAAHAKNRARHHKDIHKLAERLVSRAPFGTLSFEDAFAKAAVIIHGPTAPGMTLALHVQATRSRAALELALVEAGMTPEQAAIEVFLNETFGPTDGDDGPAGGTRPDGPGKGPRGGGGGNRQRPAAEASKSPTALGGKGKRGSGDAAERPITETEMEQVRTLARGLGGTDKLSARNVREALGCRNDHAIRVRDAVQAEARSRVEADTPTD